MPIQAMSKKDFLKLPPSTGGHPEYVAYLRAAKAGDGGKVVVAQEGTSRPTVKNRFNTAAKITGRTIKFMRSDKETVVFQVVE